MGRKGRENLETVFDGSERAFYEFCLKYDVDYYVFNPAMFGKVDKKQQRNWIYSSRYISGRKGYFDQTEIYKLMASPGELDYFFWFSDFETDAETKQFRSIQYRIFRVATPDNIKKAREHLALGGKHLTEQYFQNQDKQALVLAEKELLAALRLYPGLKEAHTKLATVFLAQGNEDAANMAAKRAMKLMEKERND